MMDDKIGQVRSQHHRPIPTAKPRPPLSVEPVVTTLFLSHLDRLLGVSMEQPASMHFLRSRNMFLPSGWMTDTLITRTALPSSQTEAII